MSEPRRDGGGEVGDGGDRAPEHPPPIDLAAAFDAHGHALYGFAVNALRDRGVAEDCVQEAFLRAWRARDRFDPARASLRTWLFAIIRNVIADAMRARERMPRVHAERGDAAAEPRPAGGSDAPGDPLERLAILEALATLSPPHREVLLAVHVYGLSYDELARRTGVAATTLRTRAYYALRALRPHLESPEGSDD